MQAHVSSTCIIPCCCALVLKMQQKKQVLATVLALFLLLFRNFTKTELTLFCLPSVSVFCVLWVVAMGCRSQKSMVRMYQQQEWLFLSEIKEPWFQKLSKNIVKYICHCYHCKQCVCCVRINSLTDITVTKFVKRANLWMSMLNQPLAHMCHSF